MRSKYYRTFFHPSRTVVHATAQRRLGLVNERGQRNVRGPSFAEEKLIPRSRT